MIGVLHRAFSVSQNSLLLFYHGVGNRNALMPRGHFLLSSHKRKQKEPRGVPRDPRARHFGSLLFVRHVGTRSANLPKLDHSRGLKHMGRFVFCSAHATHCVAQKIPSRATQKDSAGAALAYRKLFGAQSIFSIILLCETILTHTESYCEIDRFITKPSSHDLLPTA